MTRTHALQKLLEHGPLPQWEIVQITGWKPAKVSDVLGHLQQTRRACHSGNQGRWTLWRLRNAV